jgi:RecJ-like exonuclease
MPTQCPECGGSGKVHVATYDRTKIPGHEINAGTWVKNQTVAAPNAVPCRVCYGKGSI